jgi:hypothetical protein
MGVVPFGDFPFISNAEIFSINCCEVIRDGLWSEISKGRRGVEIKR